MSHSSLKDHVLVLNKFWSPVGIYGVKKIVTRMFKGHCIYIDCFAATEFDKPTWNEYPLLSDEDKGITGWLDLEVQPGQLSIKATRGRYLATPRVVKFDSYENIPKADVKFNRSHLMQRDGGLCQYCLTKVGTKGTIDHVMPRVQGGKNGWLNSVWACQKCNNKKAGRTPEQARMKLHQKPFKPQSTLAFAVGMAHLAPEWSPFLAKVDKTVDASLALSKDG